MVQAERGSKIVIKLKESCKDFAKKVGPQTPAAAKGGRGRTVSQPRCSSTQADRQAGRQARRARLADEGGAVVLWL